MASRGLSGPKRNSIDQTDMNQPLMQQTIKEAQSLPNQQELAQLKYAKQPALTSSSKSRLGRIQSKSQNSSPGINIFEIDEEQTALLQDLFDDGEAISGYKKHNDIDKGGPKGYFRQFFDTTPVFLPNQAGILAWKAIIAGIILLFFFVIPITLTYSPLVWHRIGYPAMKSVTYVSFVFLSLDIMLEFITAYYEHGNFITQKDKIAKNYIQTYFFFDLIAVLTFGIVSSLNTDSGHFFLLLFYLKYPSLMKIEYQFEEVTLLHRTLRTMYNFGKIIVILQFCFLIFACVFYGIGKACVARGMNSWLLNDGNFGVIDYMDEGSQFFFSFYFALGTMTTTMGYGDITPLNVFECTWCLGGILFAVFIFQVNVNSLFKIMEEFNQFPLRIYKQRVAINRFMRSKNVPQATQERVRRFLNENWYEEGNRDTFLEQQIIGTLPPDIKEDLLFNSYGSFLQNIPMFRDNFSRDFLKYLALSVEEINYSQFDIIFLDKTSNQIDDQSFYFIASGTILIKINTSPQRPYWLMKLEDNQYFGEWSFLSGLDRTASAQALTYCNLFKIQRKNFLEVLNQFPDDFEVYWMLRDKMMFQKNFTCIQQRCWTCDSPYHYSTQCDLTHYMPKIEKLVDIGSLDHTKQERTKYNRLDKERWPTIKNSVFLTIKLKRTQLTYQAQKILQNEENNQKSTEQTKGDKSKPPIKNMSQQASQLTKDFKIHGQLKDIDRPYQFKNYFTKNNYSNVNAFKNYSQVSAGVGRISMALNQSSIGLRQSMLYKKM